MLSPWCDIGGQLRRLRKSKGLSGEEVARRLRCSQSRISKIERGSILVTSEFLKLFCRKLQIDTNVESRLLEQLEINSISYQRLRGTEGDFARIQHLIGESEKKASLHRAFTWFIVPGLLQSERYSRAVFETATSDENELRSAVSERKKRQSVLESSDKTFQFVISEAVLLNIFGSYDVLTEQLLILKEFVKNSLHELRILPHSAVITPIPVNNFTILDDRVATIETQFGTISHWEPSDIVALSNVFTSLLGLSVGGDRATQIIDKYLSRN